MDVPTLIEDLKPNGSSRMIVKRVRKFMCSKIHPSATPYSIVRRDN